MNKYMSDHNLTINHISGHKNKPYGYRYKFGGHPDLKMY